MPGSLLGSQLATLEPLGEDEAGLTLPGTAPLEKIADAACAWLAGHQRSEHR